MEEEKKAPTHKIRRVLASEQVADLIKELIKTEQWKVGERLPPESELAESFGVNRLTVRMALQKLGDLGIVETRTGEGSFVRAFSFQNYIGAAADFCLKPELKENIFEFRKVVEIECARLAMERATPQELKDLESILDVYYEARVDFNESMDPEDFGELVDLDLRFHSQIVKMSHNVLFVYAFAVAKASIHQYLGAIIRERTERLVKADRDPRDAVVRADDLHCAVLEAIKNKDLEACRRAYLSMVDFGY